jgi:hypothetical protein
MASSTLMMKPGPLIAFEASTTPDGVGQHQMRAWANTLPAPQGIKNGGYEAEFLSETT